MGDTGSAGSNAAASGSSSLARQGGAAVAPSYDADGDMAMDGQDDDDDDPVVATYPVFYSPAYADALTLLQFPDKPARPGASRPLVPPALAPKPSSRQAKQKGKSARGGGDDAQEEDDDDEDDDSDEERRRGGPSAAARNAPMHVKYKPQTNHLELDVPIERHRERYNLDLARDFGRGTPAGVAAQQEAQVAAAQQQQQQSGGRGRGRGRLAVPLPMPDVDDANAPKLEAITYASQEIPDQSNYVAGVWRDGALHLNPILRSYQLRPALKYLDVIAARERLAKSQAARQAALDEGEEVEDAEEAEESGAAGGSATAGTANKSGGDTSKAAIQVQVRRGDDNTRGRGGQGAGGPGGSGRASASLFDPLRDAEAESWVSLNHFYADVSALIAAKSQLLYHYMC